MNKDQRLPGTPARRERYRFGFVLNTTIGNMTRYLNLRKYAEGDAEVDFTWAPVNHYTPPDFPSRLRFLPAPLFMRARLLQQAHPVMGRLEHFDAVMIHLFESEILCALRSYFRNEPVRISSTDEAPIVDRSRYPMYPAEIDKPVWRQKLRLALDMWRVRRTDQFIPFSQFAADILIHRCGAPAERVLPLHVGLDLELWRAVQRPAAGVAGRPKILFVGGDFVRKGGDLLLDVFRNRFHRVAELHLVTRQAPKVLPEHVFVHADFHPNDSRLRALYSSADMLVIPTTADLGPAWVFLEAAAMGLPIISTDTGATTEVVRHGETGLVVPVGDADALAEALQVLLDDAPLRRRMGASGRALIEERYDAAVNVPEILRTMKEAVDARRAMRGG